MRLFHLGLDSAANFLFNVDDFDFSDDEEAEPTPSRRNVLSEPNKTLKVENPAKEVEPYKAFKPTPVISPIWGV